jgi:hypothetical protein
MPDRALKPVRALARPPRGTFASLDKGADAK